MIKENDIQALDTDDIAFSIISLENYLKQNNPRFINEHFTFIIVQSSNQEVCCIDFEDYTLQDASLICLSTKQFVDVSHLCQSEGYALSFNQGFINSLSGHQMQSWLYRLFNHHIYAPFLKLDPKHSNILNSTLNALKQESNDLRSSQSKLLIQQHFETLVLYISRDHEQHYPTPREMHYKLFMDFQKLMNTYLSFFRNVQFYLNELKVSLKQLNLACKKVVGMTSKEYINQQLIIEIKKDLLFTNLSTNELAKEFHFDEATNFIKYLRKYADHSPTSFREQNS